MYIVTHPDRSTTPIPDAKGYRIDKRTGTLTVWGKHFTTLAAYPRGAWLVVSETAPAYGQA